MDWHKKYPETDNSYDLFFHENYDTLQRWAIQITKYDQELAEDLVHDVYVRFSQRDEKPNDVDSAHAYLYAAIKNAYLSHLRRRTRTGAVQFPLLDHELADNVLLVVDPRSMIKIHDDLRAICEYACSRKSSSISASILILRFFHGYYSAEVARLIKRSRNAVEARLLNARREVNIYLSNSEADVTSKARTDVKKQRTSAPKDVVSELRDRVFSATEGACLSRKHLRSFYKKLDGAVGRRELSHLVSCRKCLDVANEILHIPLLAERHPLDSLGPQTAEEIFQGIRANAATASVIWFVLAWLLNFDALLDLDINFL